MKTRDERFLTDAEGNRVAVVLDFAEYERLLEELEELEAIRAYDAAKSESEEVVPFQQAIAEIERKRG